MKVAGRLEAGVRLQGYLAYGDPADGVQHNLRILIVTLSWRLLICRKGLSGRFPQSELFSYRVVFLKISLGDIQAKQLFAHFLFITTKTTSSPVHQFPVGCVQCVCQLLHNQCRLARERCLVELKFSLSELRILQVELLLHELGERSPLPALASKIQTSLVLLWRLSR